MLSYHNDTAVKAKFQARFAAHREVDAVIQGTGYVVTGYNGLGRGCFVGCTLQNYDHSQFPVELGWPEWLARLADNIFEGLPKAEAPQFGTDLLAAVPVGVDLEPVKYHLTIARHVQQLARLKGNNEPYAVQVRAALQGVIDWACGTVGGMVGGRVGGMVGGMVGGRVGGTVGCLSTRTRHPAYGAAVDGKGVMMGETSFKLGDKVRVISGRGKSSGPASYDLPEDGREYTIAAMGSGALYFYELQDGLGYNQIRFEHVPENCRYRLMWSDGTISSWSFPSVEAAKKHALTTVAPGDTFAVVDVIRLPLANFMVEHRKEAVPI